jgi:hypothetical protein
MPRRVPFTPERDAVSNIIVGLFAILLCAVNAAVWTLVSEMPFMGAAWALAAVACIWMQRWSKN